MCRFMVLKERLPNYLYNRTCHEVPTFRKVTSITNMSGDSFSDAFKQLFVANKFLDGMITTNVGEKLSRCSIFSVVNPKTLLECAAML